MKGTCVSLCTCGSGVYIFHQAFPLPNNQHTFLLHGGTVGKLFPKRMLLSDAGKLLNYLSDASAIYSAGHMM